MNEAAGGAGAAGAGEAGAAGAAGAAASAAGAGSAGAGAAPWHGLTDANEAAFVSNKGWKSPADVIKSYRSAETLIGRPADSLLTIPKEGDDVAWAQTYDRLGRPKDATGYDLKVGLPENSQVDEQFMGEVGKLFHGAGLSAAQAKKVSEGYNKMAVARQAQTEKDALANFTADKAQLAKDWGGGYEQQLAAGKLAINELGFTEEMVNALQAEMGYRGAMTFFAGLGKRLSDPKLVSGDGSPRFDGTMTPAEAVEEIRKMKMDSGIVASLQNKAHAAHKENKERWHKMHQIAYPG